MRRLNPRCQTVAGFALIEFLIALALFSVAVAGALRAQLDALSGTRTVVAQVRSARVLQDLVGREAAAALAALAPAALPLPRGDGPAGLPASLDGWVASARPGQAGPPAATLCINRRAPLVELAIVFETRDGRPGGHCGGDGRRVIALAVAP